MYQENEICENVVSNKYETWLEHKRNYDTTRCAYKLGKNAVENDKNHTLYLSSDMQVVILIPNYPVSRFACSQAMWF